MCIDQGMKAVTEGYKQCNYFFAFYCTLRECKKHPAKIIWRDDRPVKLKCGIANIQCNLPAGHDVWDLQRVDCIQVSGIIMLHVYAQSYPPWYTTYCSIDYMFLVPRKKLNLPLDYYSHGVPQHLGQIADYMSEWEGPIAESLGLTPADGADIKTKHRTELNLQK